MGFTGGKLHGQKGQKACSNYKGKNLCGSREPINAKVAACSGNEKLITKCDINYSTSDCAHDEDVVIECTGDSGDTSGASQKNNHEAIVPPPLGKLPLMPIVAAQCNS